MSERNPPERREVLEAQLLLRMGRIEEAEAAWLRVIDRWPTDLQALNMVALASIRLGQFNRARELLERAVVVDPSHASSHHHLGRTAELLGDLPRARDHYARAAALSEELPAARLHLGAVLERLGEARAALLQYARVLGDMQGKGRWTNTDTTPPMLQDLVRHASEVVRSGRHALLFDLLEPLVAQHGRTELQRVETMLRVHLGEAQVRMPDPRQRPTFLYFPGLPTSPWIPRDALGWAEEFESRTDAILAELESLLPSQAGNERVFSTTALEDQNLRGTRGPPSWTGYYFYRHGERRDDNCLACPATSAALDALPLCRVREHGPEVLFSVFTPGTHLLAHRGVTNTRIVAHLPLIVPADCALRVGGEDHGWRKGRVVAFDDTYEHEAWNRSDSMRVVLIFDLWNPYLTEVERLAVASTVETLGDFRKALQAA